jgi:hypothetical protein
MSWNSVSWPLLPRAAVAGDNDGVGAGGGEVLFGGDDHAVDVASAGVIDEQVEAVPEDVAAVEAQFGLKFLRFVPMTG